MDERDEEELRRLDRKAWGPGWMSVGEAAERYGVSIREIYRRLADGELRGERWGRVILVADDDGPEPLLVGGC